MACLREHLRPAMGCTEPIAVAYAAALLRGLLQEVPEQVDVRVSGNIIKNAMAVTVPNTCGRHGIDVACAAGLLAGRADMELQVLAGVTAEDLESIDVFLRKKAISVGIRENARIFDIEITGRTGSHTVSVRLADHHTHVVSMTLDGKSLVDTPLGDEADAAPEMETDLSISAIHDFARTCDLQEIRSILDEQIRCNMAICEEGLRNTWGAAVGKTILETFGGDDLHVLARAMAAAGSDARMAGCEMPVIINSGSGNQGITVSVPVIVYARAMQVPDEKLYRALILANLVAIHEKSTIGCLSAYCGAVSAGCASGAGIAFLHDAPLAVIEKTIVNSLAILSGTICDGAKPSCAAKIASAVDAGILAYEMAARERCFQNGEGIVKHGVENTIESIGRLARDGMRGTDDEILQIMIAES